MREHGRGEGWRWALAAVVLGLGALGAPGCDEAEREGEAHAPLEPLGEPRVEPELETGEVQAALSTSTTTTFQAGADGYAGARDTTLSQGEPTGVMGGATTLYVDGDDPVGSGRDLVALLRFDVSSIPPGSVVEAVSLTFRVTNATAGSYPVYALRRAFVESEATWQRASAGSAWEVAGAAGAGDRGTTALGALSATSTGTATLALNTAGLAVVQGWVDAPAGNFGLALASASVSDGVDVASREAATLAYRPRLTITWRPEGTPAPDTSGNAVLLAAGDIGNCNTSQDAATGNLLDAHPGTIALLGDIAYQNGTASEFSNCFHPPWGRHKARMRPSPGNHEYYTSGARGYYGYFGAAAGDPSRGYYSYDLGAWHVVVLNSNCSDVGGCGVGSAQERWLRADLAAHPRTCTLAYWHHPRFSSGSHGNNSATSPLWKALMDHGADVVLTGHDHDYERFRAQDAAGNARADGLVQFVVGTGGTSLRAFTRPQPANSMVRNANTWGVLKLTLKPAGYDWAFLPIAGQSWTDVGSAACR